MKQVEDQRQEQRCSCKVQQPCKANAACAGKGSSRNNFTGGCAFGGLALRCCRSETRRRERFFGHPTASQLRNLFCRRPGAGFTWLLAWQLGCSVAPSAATLGRLSASVELRTTDPPSHPTLASGICLWLCCSVRPSTLTRSRTDWRLLVVGHIRVGRSDSMDNSLAAARTARRPRPSGIRACTPKKIVDRLRLR